MALIAISGYAGSGKDLVGKIIQFLHAPETEHVTLQDVIEDYPSYKDWLVDTTDWEIKKWAGKLKEVASMLTGIPMEKFEDQEFKKTNLGPEWDFWTISVISNGKLMFKKGRYSSKEEAEADIPHLINAYGVFRMEYVVDMQQTSVRDFLQKLGTEGLRTGLHTNVWVNALMSEYVPITDQSYVLSDGSYLDLRQLPGHPVYPDWIITDTRFENEAEAIKKAGGIIIRVNRPGVKPTNDHPSEVGLDHYDFDYVITNDGSIEDLAGMVKEVLLQANILDNEEDDSSEY